MSPKDTRHSQHILKDPHVAFSTTWVDSLNCKNRKAIQGLGVCHPAKNHTDVAKGIKLLYEKFPDLRDTLTIRWVMENVWGSKIWVLTPTYIKHWNDERYGDEESGEFTF